MAAAAAHPDIDVGWWLLRGIDTLKAAAYGEACQYIVLYTNLGSFTATSSLEHRGVCGSSMVDRRTCVT